MPEVTKKSLVFVKTPGFWSKQYAEDQNDSFGSMTREIKVVAGGKEYYIQKDGKPVSGVVSTFDRQLLKLALMPFFTGPSTGKGQGFLLTAAKYAADLGRVLGSLAEKECMIHAVYGTRKFAFEPKTLLNFVVSAAAISVESRKLYGDQTDDEPAKEEDPTEVVTGDLL